MKATALLITFITGLLFLVGVFVIKKVNNKERILEFSTALAFSVIIGLIALDLFPEILETFENLGTNKAVIYILGFTLIGLIVLKLLDLLVPVHNHDHHDDEKDQHEHNAHLYHVGFITSIALVIHNMIEGMAIYTVSSTNIKLGILMGIGVGLHNIPMGMEIAASLDMSKKDITSKAIIYFLLLISPFIGAVLVLLNNNINDILLGILMCLTVGMLLYISLFELLHEIKHHYKSKVTISGLVLGIILMILTLFI